MSIDYTELKILPRIKKPSDLAGLSDEELDLLSEEIRRYLVSVVSQTGGHLASNLGVVEATIALNKVFSFDNDRIVFDVGHQSYVHKLLTGRAESFETLRQRGGIAGFPKTNESGYDAFNTGHSSTSVSAAIGIMRADALLKRERRVVAFIGDGALTGGMAYEALDDVGQQQLPLIVILNDNEMSISGNVGGLSRHLIKLRSARGYRGFKKGFSSFLKHIPFCGKWLSDRFEGLKNRIKYFILPNVLFEELGFTYLGPVNGHDIRALVSAFEHAKEMDKPVLVHIITKKGTTTSTTMWWAAAAESSPPAISERQRRPSATPPYSRTSFAGLPPKTTGWWRSLPPWLRARASIHSRKVIPNASSTSALPNSTPSRWRRAWRYRARCRYSAFIHPSCRGRSISLCMTFACRISR